MSESLPILIVLIGLLALGLGVARGAWLHSPDFVARGRKCVETSLPPLPVQPAPVVRIQTRRGTKRFGSGPRSPQPGLAR